MKKHAAPQEIEYQGIWTRQPKPANLNKVVTDVFYSDGNDCRIWHTRAGWFANRGLGPGCYAVNIAGPFKDEKKAIKAARGLPSYQNGEPGEWD